MYLLGQLHACMCISMTQLFILHNSTGASEQGNMMMLHTCTIRFHNKVQFSTLNLKTASIPWPNAQEELPISRLSYTKMLYG